MCISRRLLYLAYLSSVSVTAACAHGGADSSFKDADHADVADFAATLADAARNHVRAGARPARSANAEFGILEGARSSPNGRWVAVVDDVFPLVKIVDSSATAVASIRFANDTAWDELPLVAVSDAGVLVVRPDTSRIERYRFDGTFEASAQPIRMIPLAVIAISDSTWLFYGPGRDGMWLHCLEWASGSRPRWTALDDGAPLTARDTVAPIVAARDDTVRITPQGEAPFFIDVLCGQPARAWVDRRAARESGAAFTIGSRRYELFDVRKGAGALVATRDPTPRLLLLPADKALRALGGGD